MIAICAAMRWELRPVLRSLPGVKLLRGVRPRAWLASGPGGPILVFQTGVGMDAAAVATRLILNDFPVDAVINTGCAGSLSPQMSVGAVVCGSALLTAETPQICRYATSVPLTAALTQAAEAAGLQPSRDAILTSPLPLLTPEDKAAAFARYAALAVDMEGAAIAEMVAGASRELASVRVILDDATTALPLRWIPRKTMFDFAQNVASPTLSVQEEKRFSVTAENAVIVDRVLGNLFKSFLRGDVYASRS